MNLTKDHQSHAAWSILSSGPPHKAPSNYQMIASGKLSTYCVESIIYDFCINYLLHEKPYECLIVRKHFLHYYLHQRSQSK
jgi:hypothetical protein